MTQLPSILVAGVHGFEAEEIIKLITGREIKKTDYENGVSSYNWQIRNKYYSADVNLCSINKKAVLKKEFKAIIESFIIYFDVNKKNCTAELDEWLNCIENSDISEQILICKSTKGLNEAIKDLVDDWCIKHKFELVELEPDVENIEPESFLEECTGIERVIEILHAHEWPNLTMKEKPSSSNFNIEKDFEDLKAFSSKLNEFSASGNDIDKPKCENEQIDDEELENMERLAVLFKNLQSMKNEISSLGVDQKLDQAEKVVKAFWNAIGGDSDEFSDSEGDVNNCT